MDAAFVRYIVVTGLACIAAAGLVGLRRLLDFSRFGVWYLGVFALTYVVRPVGTHVIGDCSFMYWLGLECNFDRYWFGMSLAVSAAVLCFAFGYRGLDGARSDVSERTLYLSADAPLQQRQWRFAYLLIAWGYASLWVNREVGGQVVSGSLGFGTFQQNSFYLYYSDMFVMSGVTILYAVSGRLGSSLLLSLPWLGERIAFGWQRTDMIGFVLSLLILFLVRRRSPGRQRANRGAGILLLLLFASLVLVVAPLLSLARDYFDSNVGVGKIAVAVDVKTAPRLWLRGSSDIQGFETTVFHIFGNKKTEYGTEYIYSYFILPIPRSLWKSKPMPTTLAHDWLGYQPDAYDVGWSPGSIGEAYAEWGPLGIPFEFIATGLLLGWLERWLDRDPRSASRLLCYAGFCSMLPLLAKNSIITLIAVHWLFAYGGPSLVLWRMESRSARVTSRSEVSCLSSVAQVSG